MRSERDRESTLAMGRVLDELAGLAGSPVGRVIYDQVANLVAEHGESERRLDGAYRMLVHLLLDAYAREPTPEHVTHLNARLSELRRREHRSPAEPDSITRSQPPPASDQRESPVAVAPTRVEVTSIDEGVGPAPRSEPLDAAENSVNVERRVNSAYRLHLNRKRNEIEKLQEALSQNVAETITQNREFGALLQIELRALQQADGAQEVENLRQILVGGIEELIQGQRQLDTKLARTADYLNIVKNDSDRLRDELHKVRLLSLTDEFTGLPNRRAFVRRLQDEMGRAVRYGSTLAVALIDLDGFKAINDSHGHAAGDEVLRLFSTDVLSILRHHDLAARYGGEEFAVLLPNTHRDGAVAALNKVRHRARDVRFPVKGEARPMPTFSAGIAMYIPGETHTAFIDRADRALYRAKHLGRDRTEVEQLAADGASVEESNGH